MRLPYSDFDDGTADSSVGGSADALTPRKGGDAAVTGTQRRYRQR